MTLLCVSVCVIIGFVHVCCTAPVLWLYMCANMSLLSLTHSISCSKLPMLLHGGHGHGVWEGCSTDELSHCHHAEAEGSKQVIFPLIFHPSIPHHLPLLPTAPSSPWPTTTPTNYQPPCTQKESTTSFMHALHSNPTDNQ